MPPVMIRSLSRSTNRDPAVLVDIHPRSPLCSQPSRKTWALISGRLPVAGSHARPLDHQLAGLAGSGELAVVAFITATSVKMWPAPQLPG